MNTPRVNALLAQWNDDGATRGAAFIELRDLARELEAALNNKAAHGAAVAWVITVGEDLKNTVCITADKAEADAEWEAITGPDGRWTSVYKMRALGFVDAGERTSDDDNSPSELDIDPATHPSYVAAAQRAGATFTPTSNGSAFVILPEGGVGFATTTPEPCQHDWPTVGNQTDMDGCCTKCGMSFMRYVHTECD